MGGGGSACSTRPIASSPSGWSSVAGSRATRRASRTRSTRASRSFDRGCPGRGPSRKRCRRGRAAPEIPRPVRSGYRLRDGDVRARRERRRRGTGLHKRRGAPCARDRILGPDQPRRQRPGHGIDRFPDARRLRALRHRPLEIRIDPANEPNIAIPRRLEFAEEGILRRRLPPDESGVPRDVIVFSLFRDEFPGSPASSAPIRLSTRPASASCEGHLARRPRSRSSASRGWRGARRRIGPRTPRDRGSRRADRAVARVGGRLRGDLVRISRRRRLLRLRRRVYRACTSRPRSAFSRRRS